MAELGLIVVSSLFGAGLLFNKKKTQRDTVENIKKTAPAPKVGTNVYNSRDYYHHAETEAQKVKQQWEAAKTPEETNIIPMYYNTLHVKQDSEKVANTDYKKDLILKVIRQLDPEAQDMIKSKTQTVVHDGDRRRAPDWGVVMDRPIISKDPNNPLDQIGGALVRTQDGGEDFSHNNMVPFYKGSITQDTRLTNRAKDGKLELYTGQMKLNRNKQECTPHFQPIAGLTNIHGSVEIRDVSRYKPNNTGKKNNELPFERENNGRVGPGLNAGYTSAPQDGFHPTLRIMPKGIEQFRVDPVIEQEGRVKAGKSFVDRRSSDVKAYKYKPELLVNNHGGFTTTGATQGNTERPDVMMLRDTNRKTSKPLMAHAKSAEGKAARVAPKAQRSHRQNLANTPYRNAHSVVKSVNDYGKDGFVARDNNRKVTGTRTHVIAPTGDVKHHKRRLCDKARKTRKQHYVHRKQPYRNAKTQQLEAGPAYDPKEWAAKTTVRETTEDLDHFGISKQIGGGATPAFNPEEIKARTTIRETTEDLDRYGISKAVNGGSAPAYQPEEWAAKTTIRETTEDNGHIGWVGTEGKSSQRYNLDPARTTIRETTENNNHIGGVMGIHRKHIVYDPNDRARTTIRETTEDSNHIGAAMPVIRKKHIVYNPEDRARTTIRETTEDSNHIGAASGPSKRVAGVQDKARTTIRETTENSDYVGGVSSGVLQSGKGYATNKYEAKNTNRQFTSDREYSGVAKSKDSKSKSYDSAYNARTNCNKEKIAKGRKPKGSGPKLGYQNINIEMKKLDSDRESAYTPMKGTTYGNMYNPNAVVCTSERNHLPQHDTRLDTDLLHAYKQNPLTHSLNSYY